jgi:glycosyltransferase involved in cell wall biosynthesis
LEQAFRRCSKSSGYEVGRLIGSASGLAQVKLTPGCKDATLTVTVVICTKNRPNDLRECLGAVARLDPLADQVLVVDNTDGNKETQSVCRDFGVRCITEPLPGLSRARNRGLAECETEIVAFLDDDAIPAPNWLGILVSAFADNKTAATTGRVVTPSSACDNRQAEQPRSLSKANRRWFEIATFGGLGVGLNMALRRSACVDWTVFDERLGRGAPFHIGEETYAFAGLILRGHKAVYIPAAVVSHPAHRRDPVEIEARNSFAYWLLLFSAFPTERLSLLSFISRRLRKRPLDWPRDSQEPGEIVSSSFFLLLKAGWQGLWLFLRTPRNWNSAGR